MGYKKVGMGDIVDPKEEKVEGIYMGKQENVGPNNSIIHTVKLLSTGKEVQIWGSTVLDGRLAMVPVGSQILIEYLGRAESQSRKGASFHNFNVEVWEDDGSEEGSGNAKEGKAEKDDLPF